MILNKVTKKPNASWRYIEDVFPTCEHSEESLKKLSMN